MAFAEDPAMFLADMGVACVSTLTNFTALLDQPDDIVGVGEISGVSRTYLLTYATADVALSRGAAVTVEGVAFTVREKPRQIGDGLFTEATLTKV